MQARRAARELAFIMFSQFDNKIDKYIDSDFDELILKSVRTLTNATFEDLKMAISPLVQWKENIEEYEANHEINLERPIDVSNIPVPFKMTSDVTGKIDKLIDLADNAFLALEVAEFSALSNKDEVRDYAKLIALQYKNNLVEVDGFIKKYAHGWDISRLVKMDKDILRIAIVEMLYIKEAPAKVIIDEALELAKKYSTDDSSSFINGILAKVIEENRLLI